MLPTRLYQAAFVLLVALLLISCLTWTWFIAVKDNRSDVVDALVLFAGGNGERLDKALALLEQGRAKALIANPGVEKWSGDVPVRALCNSGSDEFEVLCVTSPGDTTADEARVFADVARREGFDSLMVVTGSTHQFRATRWMKSCFDGDVVSASATVRVNRRRVIHEWGGVVQFAILGFRCIQPADKSN